MPSTLYEKRTKEQKYPTASIEGSTANTSQGRIKNKNIQLPRLREQGTKEQQYLTASIEGSTANTSHWVNKINPPENLFKYAGTRLQQYINRSGPSKKRS